MFSNQDRAGQERKYAILNCIRIILNEVNVVSYFKKLKLSPFLKIDL
jgi:hypothetical protein